MLLNYQVCAECGMSREDTLAEGEYLGIADPICCGGGAA